MKSYDMPRFHFHVHGDRDWPDDTGVELPTVDQARIEALVHAADILKDSAWSGPFAQSWRMDVTDWKGNTIMSLRFSSSE